MGLSQSWLMAGLGARAVTGQKHRSPEVQTPLLKRNRFMGWSYGLLFHIP